MSLEIIIYFYHMQPFKKNTSINCNTKLKYNLKNLQNKFMKIELKIK